MHSFADINPTLEDVKKRLGVVEGKKSTLLSDLLTSQSSLSGINRGQLLSEHFCFLLFYHCSKSLLLLLYAS